MGKRIHVFTKREVEHSGGFFNWSAEELYKLLRDKGADIELGSGEEYNDEYSDWTIEEESFKTAIRRIRRMNGNSLSKYFDSRFVEQEEIVKHLETMEQIGDHHDGYYYFCWY